MGNNPHEDRESRLIWIDLEMTGLSPDHDLILEVATVVTDKNLNVIAEGPVLAVHQESSVLDSMDEWCKATHTANGLIDRVRATFCTESGAEMETVAFLEKWVPPKKSPMCGNSICQDRRFLAKYMPTLEAYFHYRHIDVSTVKELTARWAPDVLSGVAKANNHLALDDIRDSIAELAYYRQHFFKL